MPNHYDIDIWCDHCGGYVGTIYPDEHNKTIERICKSCKANLIEDHTSLDNAIEKFLTGESDSGNSSGL